MSIFTSKKGWKFLIKIQVTKSDPKKTRGWKVPCLMPIRVKALPPVMTDRISGPTQENTKVLGKSLSKGFKNYKTKFVLPLSLHNLLKE